MAVSIVSVQWERKGIGWGHGQHLDHEGPCMLRPSVQTRLEGSREPWNILRVRGGERRDQCVL